MQYANPDALVSTEWLAQNLTAPGVRVLDGTYFLPNMKRDPATEYAAKHIPGAILFDVDAVSDHNSSLPHMLPSADEFARAMGERGIANGDHVVVYDALGLVLPKTGPVGGVVCSQLVFEGMPDSLRKKVPPWPSSRPVAPNDLARGFGAVPGGKDIVL